MTEQGTTDSESSDGRVDAESTPADSPEASADHEGGDATAADGDQGVDGHATGERADEAQAAEAEAAEGHASEQEAAEVDAAEEAEPDVDADAAGDAESAVDGELVERVENADPESIAREIAALRVEVEGLEARLEDKDETIDELESKLARARADFQNYKKRAEKRREEEAERAKADLVERLLSVHDNLQRALDQDEDVDIRGGVESTLSQFDEVLDAEDVAPIDPDSGTEVDPHRHEVLVRVESDRPEGVIEDVHRIGYEMGETIVREAQVTVSDGSGHEGAAKDEGGEKGAAADADGKADGDAEE